MAVRPVDAEKYMELLKEQYLHHEAMGNKQVAKAWQGAMQLLYDMPTLTPPNEWISAEDRLPEPGDLIVYADNTVWGYQYGICRVCGKEKAFDHWMPLQDPPNNRPPEEEEET